MTIFDLRSVSPLMQAGCGDVVVFGDLVQQHKGVLATLQDLVHAVVELSGVPGSCNPWSAGGIGR
jgi:hypothetical protein